MDEKAGKGRDFDTQRLNFHSLGGLQRLDEFLEKRVIIVIEKGDRADEGNAYQDLGNIYFSLGDFRKAIEYHKKLLKIAIEIVVGPGKEELMEISVLLTFHWMTSEKPLSMRKTT